MHTDPTVLADLEELERALAGEPSTFNELVADVRAQRPQMDPAFAARLDARVDEARKAPPRPSWLAWSPLAGLAAALVVAVVVVSGGGDSANRSASSGVSGASTSADRSAKSAAPAAPALSRGATSESSPAIGRKVERNTTMQ